MEVKVDLRGYHRDIMTPSYPTPVAQPSSLLDAVTAYL